MCFFQSRTKDQQELETIPEDEALPLTLASPPHRIKLEVNSNNEAEVDGSASNATKSKKVEKALHEGFIRMKTRDLDLPEEEAGDDIDEQNLHSMSRYELLQLLRRLREEKRGYRKRMKEMEESFYRENGRRLLKEDRDHSENIYALYKNSKAKIKLIDALLSKDTSNAL